jgi:UDP-glucose 4-epimerase
MRVLVTGGSGFIGSHVVDRLAAAGHSPRIFDLRPSPHHPRGEVDTVLGDLLDPGSLHAAMRDCDAVIHLAAAADVNIVAEQPEDAEHLNAHGTVAVLEAARATGIGRVVYGSTIWVYGESGDGVLDEDTLLGLPRHVYTSSKLAGEMYCASYAELYDVPYTILRFGIPYGPRSRPAAVIPAFVRKATAGEPLTIAGDGSQSRRFIYVEDLADGVVRALDPCAADRIYNLASDRTVTIRELAEEVRELVGDVELVHTPGRSGDFDGAEISSRRAKQELGWSALTPLREGLRRYLAWLGDTGAVERQPVVAVEEPEPAARRPSALELPLGDARVTALACTVGTLIPYAMARGLDRFDTAQVHAVGLTTLFATLTCLFLLQSAAARRLRAGLAPLGWLVCVYFALFVLPWPRHALTLALPEIPTLLLSAAGTVMALAAAAGVNLIRAQQAASDRVT